MTIHDERDVAARLHAALDDLDAPPLPMHTVVRKGRSVMIRRRLAIAAAAAAVIAAGLSAPALIHNLSRPPTPTGHPPHYRVTVYAPGPGSPKGLIAYGRIDGHRWHVSGWRSAKYGLCFGGDSASCLGGPPARSSHRGSPAKMLTASGGTPQFDVATVRADVMYLRIGLRGGQQLTLRAVPVFGPGYARYVAVALPSAAAVTTVTAYSAHGEIAYAVPFTLNGSVTIERWFRPGQLARPRPARYQIGSGVAAGRRWAEYIYVGPWGSCLSGAGGASYGYECWPLGISALAKRQGTGQLALNGSPDRTFFVALAAASPASYVVVSEADGSLSRVRLVPVGSARLCVIASVKGDRATAWTAYSAAGVKVGSGRF